MKKAAMLMVLVIVLQSNVSVAVTVNPAAVNVYLDNKRISFTGDYGQPFIDESSRTQIPFRIVLEKFGATVTWDDENKMAIAIKGNIEVKVPIGSRYIERNTEVIMIDTEAVIVENRTYIPIRAVMEAFGCSVTWDGDSRSVMITSPKDQVVISRLPITYDLRKLGKMTAIKDQLDIGACWAFATLGAMESALMPDKKYDFSEDNMSLMHGYNLTQDEGGDFQISLAYLARWSGPVLEREDPYDDGIVNTTAKAAVHVQEALILPKKDFSAIKRAVMAYGGVQTSIHIRDIYNQIFGDAYNPETYAFYYTGTAKPNHDVVIVGWDDHYSMDNFNVTPTRDGAFICRNSYGTDFGDNGYFYVSYDDILVGDENIVYTRIESKSNYDHIYQSDWLGWVGRIGYGKDTAYFSNVYTAEDIQKLEAVSFYATGMDTSYEIYVIESFESVDDFQNMTFVDRGGLDYSGYYTIDFENPIEVEGDYAVIVKVTTPDSLFPVAAEFYKDVTWLDEDSVDISDGRGFMSYDGMLWESTEEILQSNVSLKAFTSNITE